MYITPHRGRVQGQLLRACGLRERHLERPDQQVIAVRRLSPLPLSGFLIVLIFFWHRAGIVYAVGGCCNVGIVGGAAAA